MVCTCQNVKDTCNISTKSNNCMMVNILHLQKPILRDHPIIRTDLQIQTMFGFWLRTFITKKICTPHNNYRISRCTDYFPDQNPNIQLPQTHQTTKISMLFGTHQNLNVVPICKTVQIIGQSVNFSNMLYACFIQIDSIKI